MEMHSAAEIDDDHDDDDNNEGRQKQVRKKYIVYTRYTCVHSRSAISIKAIIFCHLTAIQFSGRVAQRWPAKANIWLKVRRHTHVTAIRQLDWCFLFLFANSRSRTPSSGPHQQKRHTKRDKYLCVSDCLWPTHGRTHSVAILRWPITTGNCTWYIDFYVCDADKETKTRNPSLPITPPHRIESSKCIRKKWTNGIGQSERNMF